MTDALTFTYPQPPIVERFDRFHQAHPEVYDELVRLARQAKTAGQKRLGIAMLYEVVRWNRTIAGLPEDGEPFKLNNDFRALYARLIMQCNRDLADVFETRSS